MLVELGGRGTVLGMTDAGFTSTRAEHLVGPDSMVIGVR